MGDDMSFKGVKCTNCGRDIGCPHCGQLLPDLRMVSMEINNETLYFCTAQCRDNWIEKRK